MVIIQPCETLCEKHVHCQCEGEIRWCYKATQQIEEITIGNRHELKVFL
jgi:hypothetical protein